uniref:Uncharacterized protein n=1 Tax=Strigamia maritima TaxID=126957 RepID=T1JGB6_STRMM
MLTPVHLLRALHWRPYEGGIACLVQLDVSNEPWKTPGILPRLAAEYLWILNKMKRNQQVEGDVFCSASSPSKREKSIMTTRMSKGNFKALMLLMEETSSRAMKIAHPIPVDNLAVGKALKRFLGEPVLIGILMLQYVAVTVVVLVISLFRDPLSDRPNVLQD